jgi:hypothetical protein
MTSGEGETTEQRAEADFEMKDRFNRLVDEELGGRGYLAEDGTNIALGQNILREEIGYFGPWKGARYSFDEETRDRLLAHGRQDVASAFAMARSAFKEAHWARRVAARAVVLLWVMLLVNLAVLATLWFGP